MTDDEDIFDEVDDVLERSEDHISGSDPEGEHREDTAPETSNEVVHGDGGEKETNKAGKAIGSAAGGLTAAIGRFTQSIALGFFSRVPKGVGIGQNLHAMGTKIIKKKSGSQFVVNTIYGDGAIVPRPGGLDSEKQIVETDNGEFWSADNGVDLNWVGNTPVCFGVADAHEMVSPVRSRIAEKIDSGPENWRVIREYSNGQVESVNWGRQPDQTIPAQGGAVTDGGLNANGSGAGVQYPAFDDIWVDLSNWVDDADGMICSMSKAYETTHDKAGTEALQDQETRGRLAEAELGDQTKWALWLAAALLGGLLLGLFGPALASQVAGAAGGAGGGGIPLVGGLV